MAAIYYALVDFHFFGQDYTAGQAIDVTGWTEHGLQQLIDTGNVTVQAPDAAETDPIAGPEVAAETTRAETAETALGLASATTKTADYTFALVDGGTVVEGSAAGALTFTIPANATVAFPVGTCIEVFQYGAGQITIAAAGGVTLRSPSSLVKTATQYASVSLRKRGTDEWVLEGDLA